MINNNAFISTRQSDFIIAALMSFSGQHLDCRHALLALPATCDRG